MLSSQGFNVYSYYFTVKLISKMRVSRLRKVYCNVLKMVYWDAWRKCWNFSFKGTSNSKLPTKKLRCIYSRLSYWLYLDLVCWAIMYLMFTTWGIGGCPLNYRFYSLILRENWQHFRTVCGCELVVEYLPSRGEQLKGIIIKGKNKSWEC